MPFKRFDQAKPYVTLGLVALAWLVLPVGLKLFTRASFFELTAPITVSFSHARDLQSYWSLRLHSKTQLIEAGRDLARLNASYELAVERNTELRDELTRLEALLHVPPPAGYRSEVARVARRDFSAWWQQMVIRKGRNYGITVGAPVVFSGGVVGRVTEVHATTSVVDLISSPDVRLAGEIDGNTQPISYQGGLNPTLGPPQGTVEFVPLDVFASASAPKRLITSGLGGVFPPGLTIGMITRLEPAGDGLFQTGEVRLDERLASLTEVTVLVPLNSK